VKKIVVEKNSYYDSVFLMLINKELKKIPGVKDAAISMGTEMNVELFKEIGFFNQDVEGVTPNDLIIAVEGESEEIVENALRSARTMLKEKKHVADEYGEYRPVSLDTAIKMVPDANLVVISVPGAYAVREAQKALEKDLHVMLFSDNVSLEEEVELKKLAKEKGLLMMGPDCGTAIINGIPLCFANVIRRGNIGLVGASGTGLQEVSCIIHRCGGGITHAIGTGGRDLKSSLVGGTTMLMGIESLENDPNTSVIVVISKPPAENVAEKVIETLRKTRKPCIIHFVGLEPLKKENNLYFAGNLEETSNMAVALARGEAYEPHTFTIPEKDVVKIIETETEQMSPNQKFLRGLYTGGTLADEAMILFDKRIGEIHSNIQTKQDLILKDPQISEGHTIVDLGDDTFTVGRPHPMIDPSTREERLLKEMKDSEVAVFLLDMVLGYGSHEDPAGAILESLKMAKKMAEDRGGYLSILASITGTEGDFQNANEQKDKLESIGCVVMPSNYQASMLAIRIIQKLC